MRFALVAAVFVAGCASPAEPEDKAAAPARRTRVLYVERLPRWEYRYLKNVLVRDDGLDAHVWLTTAEPGFPQEHSLASPDPKFQAPAGALPRTMEDLLDYDVVVLGDVAPKDVPAGLPALLKAFVEEKGRGLVLMAGESMAREWKSGEMATLIPVKDLDGPVEGAAGYRVTEEGGKHVITAPADAWAALPNLVWHAPVEAGENAATLVTYDGEALFVVAERGRGRVFFSATDGTWAWRRSSGDAPHHAPFWKRVIEWARGE